MFPSQRHFKLLTRSDGSIQVLERNNVQAYTLDLTREYNVNIIFNESDLSIFIIDADLRADPFQEEGTDEV